MMEPPRRQPVGTSLPTLVACYELDDVDGVLAAVPGLTDDLRADAWALLGKRLLAGFLPTPHDRPLSAEAWATRVRTRARLAVAIGPADDVASRLSASVLLPPQEEPDALLASRSTEWRARFAAEVLRAWAHEPEVGLVGPLWWDWWRWTRRHERLGLLPIDGSSPDYLVIMVRGLLFSGSIEAALREDRDLIAGPVWSLFQPAAGVQAALVGAEKYWDPSNTWRVALVRLALDGAIDREGLTSAAAAAADDERLGRGHRGWYHKIPELLDHPDALPMPPTGGAPPPGNRLSPRLPAT